MPNVNVVADLHKIGEDLISMNNLITHLSMETAKRIKIISLNLIEIIHQVMPAAADLDGLKLSDEETLELAKLDGILSSLGVSVRHIEDRKQGIIDAAKRRVGAMTRSLRVASGSASIPLADLRDNLLIRMRALELIRRNITQIMENSEFDYLPSVIFLLDTIIENSNNEIAIAFQAGRE